MSAPGSALTPELRALLDSVPVGVLGTVRSDGKARQTTVYFVVERDTLWISTEAGRAKTADVERTGWASVCVVGRTSPFPSVTLEGSASIQRTGVAGITARIFARITGGEVSELDESDLTAAGRVLLRLDVSRAYGASHLSSVRP